ncbi:MAG: hypothetical protein KTQ49_07100, partial [Candidatus Omnitrophica bacterium]|nr:hypothetical protein [Candidatus Omnitrophota bacterium]
FFGVAVLSVGLKHALRFRGRNLLNPAACGIVLAVVFFQGHTEWKGAYEGLLLIPAGLYFAYKIKRTVLVACYFLTALLLFIPQGLAQQTPLTEVLGYFNFFFMFIMMIEPKTTPAPQKLQALFGSGIALFIFLLTDRGFRYEPELFALLTFNAFIPRTIKIPASQNETQKEPAV